MSEIQIYSLTKEKDMVLYAEVKNAFGGAILIWEILKTKYKEFLPSGEDVFSKPYQELWSLVGKGIFSKSDEILIASTFDRVWIKKENLQEVAEIWNGFYRYHIEGLPIEPSTKGVAQVLAKAATDPEVYGIAFNHTSVVSSFWSIFDEDKEGCQSYNFERNQGHWELYTCLSQKHSKIEPRVTYY